MGRRTDRGTERRLHKLSVKKRERERVIVTA